MGLAPYLNQINTFLCRPLHAVRLALRSADSPRCAFWAVPLIGEGSRPLCTTGIAHRDRVGIHERAGTAHPLVWQMIEMQIKKVHAAIQHIGAYMVTAYIQMWPI